MRARSALTLSTRPNVLHYCGRLILFAGSESLCHNSIWMPRARASFLAFITTSPSIVPEPPLHDSIFCWATEREGQLFLASVKRRVANVLQDICRFKLIRTLVVY